MPHSNSGFIAISSVLVISAVIVVLVTSVGLLSISDNQMSVATLNSETSRSLVEACIEDCLIRLNKTNSIPTTITLPEGSCTVTINQSTNPWIFTVTGTLNNYTSKIQVQATRGTTVTINSWQDIP